MKSDHRHELKTNELADWLAHFPEWARQNRTSLIAVAAVVVVAVVVYFWSFYRRDMMSVHNQERLTTLVTLVPRQLGGIAQAAMQNKDQSDILAQTAADLEEFAQSVSSAEMAALALIKRAEVIRAEIHYRLSDVSRDELTRKIAEAQTSYRQALEREPSSALAATAQFGLGLCEEELGDFEKAAEIYRAVTQKPEYAGTAAQAAAEYRLTIMHDYKTEVAFKPAPPPPVQSLQPPVPMIQITPGDANAPAVLRAPNDVNAGPAAPGSEAEALPAPTPPVDSPGTSDANAPAGG